MKQLKTAFDYKLNIKKVNELLNDNSKLNGFEKHTIQEGLKELLLGHGPIEINTPGNGFIFRDLTPAMKHYLLDYGVIRDVVTIDEESDSEEDSEEYSKDANRYKDLKKGPKKIEESEIKQYIKGEAKLSDITSFIPNNSVKVTMGDAKFSFKEGFQDIMFNLESGFIKRISDISLVSDRNIYYEEALIVEAGQDIPFASTYEYFEKDIFVHTKVMLMVDFRHKLKGNVFDPSKINTCGHTLKAGPVTFILTLK